LPIFFACAYAFARMNTLSFWLVCGLMVMYFAVLMRAIVVYANQFAERFLSELDNEMAARTDGLTSLPNRNAFEKEFDLKARRAARYGEKFAVYFIDLDRFKDINDNFGHEGGDEFLIEVANRLRLCTREIDFVTRFAGDEFAVLASGIEEATQALVVAERLLKAFESPFKIQNVSIQGSATIGIAMIPSDGLDRTEIMRKADEALYNAKNKRRGTFQFFDQDSENAALVKKDLVQDLREAIGNGEMRLTFQPVVDLRDNSITCFEALVRWKTPRRGEVSPAEFIPLAEKAGLIHDIGEWVIVNALKEAVRWPDHIRVAINVSAVQFRTLEIVSVVERALATTGVDPARVEFEITESVVLADVDRAESVLRDLRNLGVSISLDDFGTGYSCLTYLLRLPIDRMKIDRSFVHEIPDSPDSCKIVRVIMGLAREFEIGVIAEGAETMEQIAFIRRHGITEVQGYAISKPLPASRVAAFIESYRLEEIAAA